MAPIPKREEALARDRSRKGGNRPAVTKGQMRAAVVPDADPSWHVAAKQVYDAACTSGQADFYQSSDYAILWSLCGDLSVAKSSGRLSGQLLATIYGALDSLGLTEGERRKMRIELQPLPTPEADEGEAAVLDMRAKLGVVPGN
jgi:hypothetical protein